jgi:integrase
LRSASATWRNVPLAKLTFEGLSQWAARLAASELGPSGVRQAVFVTSAALDHAVRSGRIRANPARGLSLPRIRRRDYVFLSHEQVHHLADASGRWRPLILLLAYTGLRWGEATALRVCDVDLARRRIDVRRAYADVGGHLVLGSPGDMDRYADRLDTAIGEASTAKIRPNETDEGEADEASGR